MRKSWLPICSGIVLALFLFSAGCGGDEEQSEYKTLLSKAKKLYSQIESQWSVLEKKIEDTETKNTQIIMGAMSGNLQGIEAGKSPGLGDSAREVLADIERLKARCRSLVDPELKKYRGIDSYVFYAEAMISALDVQKVATEKGMAFLDKIDQVIASGNIAGVKTTVEQSTSSGEVQEIQRLQREAKDAFKKADEIKKSQGLESE